MIQKLDDYSHIDILQNQLEIVDARVDVVVFQNRVSPENESIPLQKSEIQLT